MWALARRHRCSRRLAPAGTMDSVVRYVANCVTSAGRSQDIPKFASSKVKQYGKSIPDRPVHLEKSLRQVRILYHGQLERVALERCAQIRVHLRRGNRLLLPTVQHEENRRGRGKSPSMDARLAKRRMDCTATQDRSGSATRAATSRLKPQQLTARPMPSMTTRSASKGGTH